MGAESTMPLTVGTDIAFFFDGFFSLLQGSNTLV